jgi:hypothetical protein
MKIAVVSQTTKAYTTGLLVVLFILGSTSAFGYHDTLQVVVNGQRLQPNQIRVLEQVSCGPIPSGRYWLDTRTGVWGYEGGRAQGRLGDRCANRNVGSPADKWVGSEGYNYRGPFGDAMSDGKCSFINGIPVGDCN